MIVRETLKCVIYAMGTPVHYNRVGLTITDCNTRNILWLRQGGKEEARIGDWGCGHAFKPKIARINFLKLLRDIDDTLQT
eukprot:11823795-Prorocentrum_lima.AAC.1